MGIYSYFNISGYDILETKGGLDREALTVFDDSDRVDDDSIRYRASVAVIRDRLETMGFTLTRSRQVLLDTAKAWAAQLAEDEGVIPDFVAQKQVCENLTFDEWVVAFRDLKQNDIHQWNRTPEMAELTGRDFDAMEALLARHPVLFEYLLEGRYGDDQYGYPPSDFRTFLRAALEACADDEPIEYALSGLAGHYAERELSPTGARESLIAAFPSNAPVIVLTEGRTDIAAIESAMRVLVPHLRSYYSFLEFSAAAAKGGATALMELVKAFAGARLANRVVAMFDNDAVGRDAVRVLSNFTLPQNIRVLLLPDLAIGDAYPTMGPSGPSSDNVNGRAASIELYFGLDVLSPPDQSLMVVRWAGFVAGVAAYQGELSDKLELQARFASKVEAALRDPETKRSQDWTGMTAVIEALRSAFR